MRNLYIILIGTTTVKGSPRIRGCSWEDNCTENLNESVKSVGSIQLTQKSSVVDFCEEGTEFSNSIKV
jgi:hypothetical protein